LGAKGVFPETASAELPRERIYNEAMRKRIAENSLYLAETAVKRGMKLNHNGLIGGFLPQQPVPSDGPINTKPDNNPLLSYFLLMRGKEKKKINDLIGIYFKPKSKKGGDSSLITGLVNNSGKNSPIITIYNVPGLESLKDKNRIQILGESGILSGDGIFNKETLERLIKGETNALLEVGKFRVGSSSPGKKDNRLYDLHLGGITGNIKYGEFGSVENQESLKILRKTFGYDEKFFNDLLKEHSFEPECGSYPTQPQEQQSPYRENQINKFWNKILSF
jgi:hypothetical protein